MATIAAAFFTGTLLGIALISRIPIWALRAWQEKNFLRLLLAHLLTYACVASAFALLSADGGSPQWQSAFAGTLIPALIVFTLDAIAILALRNAGPRVSLAPMWFLHAGGNQSGPLSTAAVETALAGGKLKPSDWIWRNGFKDWTQIESVDLSKPADASALAEGRTGPEPGPRRRPGWFAQPLGYWITGLVIAALFAASSLAFLNLEFTDHPRLVSGGLIVLWLVVLAAMLWLGIGVIRFVDRQAKASGHPYWSGAVKGLTALAGLAVLAVFVQRGVPEIRQSASVISETMSPRYQLRLLRDNTELELVGPMDFGVAAAIAASLDGNPGIVTLDVNSPGGRLSEAGKLADIVLEKNLNTYVSTLCLGDCATVFAAGKNRWLSRAAVVALHRPGADVSDLEAETAKTKAFLESRGIAAKFADRGLSSPRDAAWRPTHGELFGSGFATSYATDAEVAVAGIPMREIEDAQKALDGIGLYQVLRDKHPEAYQAIVAILRNGYVRGQPVAAMRQRIWAVILPIVNKSLSSASDSALVSFYGLAVDEAETFAAKDMKSCEAYLRGRSEGFDQSLLSAQLQERELSATAELIRTSGSYAGKPIEKQQAQAVLAQLLPVAQGQGFTPDDLEKAIQFKLTPERNCRGLILFFRSLLQLGDPGRTALLRFMAQQSGT